MNWFGNFSSAQLWTIGLSIVVLAVVVVVAYYIYSRPRREVEEERDVARDQKIQERLAQIAVPPAPWVSFRKTHPYVSDSVEPEATAGPEFPEELRDLPNREREVPTALRDVPEELRFVG